MIRYFICGCAGVLGLLTATAGAPAVHSARSAVKADRESERLLALTIWAEGRSRGPAGMSSIGHVVINRAKADGFGNGIAGVLWKHRQFSCWRSGDPNRRAMRNIGRLPRDGADWKQWEQAKQIAHGLLYGRRRDPTRGATYYAVGARAPRWARGMRQVALVGGHSFYRPVLPTGARAPG